MITPRTVPVQNRAKNIINHVVFVLDASSSMTRHSMSLVRVVDNQIQHLAKRSEQLKQETRVTVYLFADGVSCLVFDTDVLRLPSIATLYNARGNTALLDATGQSIADLRQTCTLYGDHAFLIYVLTDGEENASKVYDTHMLRSAIAAAPDTFTLGGLVPNIDGVAEMKRIGFPANNIMIWDTASSSGVEEAGIAVAAATDSYMTMRSSGGTRSSNLFGGADVLNKQTVAASGITPLPRDTYGLWQIPGVPEKTWISHWVNQEAGRKYRLGAFYYQLTKREKIQAGKLIAIREKGTDRVFQGPQARQLLKLPDSMGAIVDPAKNKDYDIFVQSNSTNRHLVPFTQLLEYPLP